MTKIEKVIKGLEYCFNSGVVACSECPYNKRPFRLCIDNLGQDALELLKTVKPKKRESKALLPCKCGCKRREHWYGGSAMDKPEGLKCEKCGFTVWGKSEMDAIRKWNEAVRE